MKTTTRQLTLGLAAAIIAVPGLLATPAESQSYRGGGLHGLRGAYVPVPAPAPIPDYAAKWYLRGDASVSLNADTQMNESGMTYGVNETTANYNASAPFGFEVLGNDSGAKYGHSIGVGAGYYYSRHLRFDFTGELLSEKKTDISGGFSYNDTVSTNMRVNGTVLDRTTLHSAVFMANGYIDLSRNSRWKPYVGGGIGFAVNDIKRTHSTSLTTCDTGTPGDCDSPTAAGSYSAEARSRYAYTLAANATVGLSYKISSVTSLDFNYRYLYVGGTDMTTVINGYTSRVNIDDQQEHHLRAGLRFDIN